MKLTDQIYYRKMNFFLVFRESTRVTGLYCALLKGEKNILIDAGVSYNLPDVEQLCAEGGITLDDVYAIIHTHNHSDHTGADAAILAAHPGIKIMCHSSGKAWIEDPALQCAARPLNYIQFLISGPVKVDRTLEDGDEIRELGRPLRVIHTPGHSCDSISFYLPDEDIIFTGDALPNLDNLPFYNDPTALLDTIDRLESINARYIFSAFNALWDSEKDGNIFDVMRERVHRVDAVVVRCMKEGKGLEDCAAEVQKAFGVEGKPASLFYTTVQKHMELHENASLH